MSNTTTSNRLADEASPYLQQHANNPVHWQPWDEQALEQARREDKPILVSIGYSACHWCHVMEHESFGDEATAAIMNEHFINIKVDREERPDLDKVYQTSHQLLVQRPGGWPLNMFIAPDTHLPIFGGTYFPPQARYGMPDFKSVLARVSDFYQNRRDELTKQYDYLTQALGKLDSHTPDGQLNDALLTEADDEIANSFDQHHGGFGGAPKFFHVPSLEYCFKRAYKTPARQRLEKHVTDTLTIMANSGIFDQLAGGFYRYSVDEQWMIPHFEKMLYDNGQLLALYAETGNVTGKPLLTQTALKIADWVLAEMTSPEGAYYSTLNADSEGEEGKFYAWSTKELKQLLNDERWQQLANHYQLEGNPNFEGQWHLHAINPNNETINTSLEPIHQRLLQARAKRSRPSRDEKILTSWNALMIRGMAVAGRLLNKPDYIDSACKAMRVMQTQLWQDNTLHATYKDGVARHPAYLDDYAYLLWALLELLQARWDDELLKFAIQIADILIADFEDEHRGGFFFTAHDHEPLPYRPKPASDDAMPSGNGIAALCLQRLGLLLGESHYLTAAENTLKATQPSMKRYLPGAGALLLALRELTQPAEIVILRGKPDELLSWQASLNEQHQPDRLVFAIPDDAQLPPSLATKTYTGSICAYRCRGLQCQEPVNEIKQLI
ncbi:MAG: thioredoxin domain-containing protein [Proteobacteria bacterium]|nr:thioredoxin domain-containing protein [Pseudomonadota bacterium]